MRSQVSLLCVSAIGLASFASGAPFHGRILQRDDELLSQYDVIIVGGGTSGLVVANRLTENPSTTVLVLEAGILIPDDQENEILVPGYVGRTGKKYDWNVTSVPDAGLQNRLGDVYSARVVGGGTVVNGMFFDRGAPADYNAWAALGNPGWDYKSLLRYFKKSETFTPPPAQQAQEFEITHEPSVHGTNGPVKASFPPFIYPHIKSFRKALISLGVSAPKDQAERAIGALWVPNALDPVTITRSYAGNAYYKPVKTRSNLHLIAERQVTKLLPKPRSSRGPVEFIGVEFATSSTSPRTNVYGKRIVLAAGAMHTPQILQLSGIGNPSTLAQFNIPKVIDLPGVGENFQDHMGIFLTFLLTLNPDPSWIFSNATYAAEVEAQYYASKTGPFTVSSGSFASFIPFQKFSQRYLSLIAQAASGSASQYLRPGVPASYVAGYAAQRKVLLAEYKSPKSAIQETLVGLVSLSKPMSRGQLTIKSNNPFDSPVLDFRTFSNPIDLEVLLDGIKFHRKIMARPQMAPFNPVEVTPGADKTDAEVEAFVRKNANPSLAHPSCSCPMMKKSFGGCVDHKLKVHGAKNLWIVDASIMPLIPATHLQATVYAIAEKAADLLKATF